MTPFGKEISITVAESYWCTARAGWMAAGRLVGTSGQCSRSAAEGKAQLLHAGNDETENLRAPTTHSTGTAYRVSIGVSSNYSILPFPMHALITTSDWSGLADAARNRQPTLLTGSSSPPSSWSAFGNWSAATLSSGSLGSRNIEYEHSSLSAFLGYETDATDAKGLDPSENRANDESVRVRGTMQEFIHRLNYDAKSSTYSYLTVRLEELGADFARDLSPLDGLAIWDDDVHPAGTDEPSLPSTLPRRASVWAGGVNVTTQLHYDLFHNVLVQLIGRKRVTLFPPSTAESFYLYGSLSPRFRKSRVPLPPNFDSWASGASSSSSGLSASALLDFPKAAAALKQGVSVELGPGDALYLPPFVLHHVQALGGAANPRGEGAGGEGGAGGGEGGEGGEGGKAGSPLTVSVNLFSPSHEIDVLDRMMSLAVPFEEAWVYEHRMIRAATVRWLRVAASACLLGEPLQDLGSRGGGGDGFAAAALETFWRELLEGFVTQGGNGLVDAMEAFAHDPKQTCGDEGRESRIVAILDSRAEPFRRRAAELDALARQLPGPTEVVREAVRRQALRRYVETVLFNFVEGTTQDARRFVQYCLLQDARSSGDLDEVDDVHVQVGDMGQQWTM